MARGDGGSGAHHDVASAALLKGALPDVLLTADDGGGIGGAVVGIKCRARQEHDLGHSWHSATRINRDPIGTRLREARVLLNHLQRGDQEADRVDHGL